MPRREWVEVELPLIDDRGEPVLEDGEPVLVTERVIRWETFARWRTRATVAFVGVFVAATGAAYLGWAAGNSSSNGLARAGKTAVLTSCLDRADGRLTTAIGFDQLRFAALTSRPRTAAQRRAIQRFLAATQDPINDLLNQAAFASQRPATPIHSTGQIVSTVHGRRRESPELRDARVFAARRCASVAHRFDASALAAG